MLRAEVVALETGAAEVAPLGVDSIMVAGEDAHRAQVNADTALNATVRIKVDLESDRCRGTDFQKRSPAPVPVVRVPHDI